MRRFLLAAPAAILLTVLPLIHSSPTSAQQSGQPLKAADRSKPQYVFPQFSVEKNPLVLTKPSGERVAFLRTLKSTCGRYSVALIDTPPGAGPPPHIHYSSDEWFYLAEGTMTMFMQADHRVFISGQRPGANAPAVTLDAFPLPAGQLAYGPLGMVHGFKNETSEFTRRFINLWTPGDGMESFLRELDQATKDIKSQAEADRLLEEISAKWGVPHDPSGSFVKEIRRTSTPAHAQDNQAARLEELIRSTEHCNPDAPKP